MRKPRPSSDKCPSECTRCKVRSASEALRTLHRVHSDGHLSDEGLGLRIAELRALVEAIDQIPLSKMVLKRAGGPLAGSVKTLDAIHLVTAMIWSEYNGE